MDCCTNRKEKKVILVHKACQTPRTDVSIQEHIVYEDIKGRMMTPRNDNKNNKDVFHRAHRIYL